MFSFCFVCPLARFAFQLDRPVRVSECPRYPSPTAKDNNNRNTKRLTPERPGTSLDKPECARPTPATRYGWRNWHTRWQWRWRGRNQVNLCNLQRSALAASEVDVSGPRSKGQGRASRRKKSTKRSDSWLATPLGRWREMKG